MKWIKKLCLKILGDSIYTPEKVEEDALHKWLIHAWNDRGFKGYYTMRKKSLVNLLALGLEGKEQWKIVGRLEELKALSSNINTAHKESVERQKRSLVIEGKK